MQDANPSASHGATARQPACAACKHQRKKCSDGCLLARFFPARRAEQFSAVHRLYGLSNLTKMLKEAPPASWDRLMATLVWEAEQRVRNPVDGCYAELERLRQENRQLREQAAAAVVQRRRPMEAGPEWDGIGYYNGHGGGNIASLGFGFGSTSLPSPATSTPPNGNGNGNSGQRMIPFFENGNGTRTSTTLDSLGSSHVADGYGH